MSAVIQNHGGKLTIASGDDSWTIAAGAVVSGDLPAFVRASGSYRNQRQAHDKIGIGGIALLSGDDSPDPVAVAPKGKS